MSLRALYLLAPVSGALALIYQALWQRELRLLMGSGPASFSLTVALFLGGLFAGYFFFGRRSHHKTNAQLFADLAAAEGLIGFFALASALLLHEHLLNLPLAILLIFCPVFMMGCFLPICSQLVSQISETAKPEASLYGSHGIGAACGAWLSGLYLLPEWGSVNLLVATALLHILVSAILLLLRRRTAKQPGEDLFALHGEKLPALVQPGRLDLQVGLAGFASIGLQMLSYRIMTLVIGDSAFIFSMVLGTSVLLIAIGGYLSRRITTIRSWKLLLPLVLTNIFVLVLVTPLLPKTASETLMPLLSLPQGFLLFHLAAIVGLIICSGPAAILLAAFTPAMIRARTTARHDLGRNVGQLWAANTLGSLLGTIGFGFLFFLLIDLKAALVLLAFSIALLLASFGKRYLYIMPVFLLCAFTPWSHEALIHSGIQSGASNWPSTGYKVVAYEDSPLGSFAVAAFSIGPRISHRLVANGRFEAASVGPHEFTSRMAVNLPMLFLSGEHLRTAVIGLGAGRSVLAINRQPRVKDIDLFEISPSVIGFQRYFFEDGKNPMSSPKIKIYVVDAFRGLQEIGASSDVKYSIIASEPSHLWAVGVSPLYTGEFYDRVNSVLQDDGIFTQWIPIYAISNGLFSDLITTWREAFPNTRAFLNRGDLILLGSKKPLPDPQDPAFQPYRPLEITDKVVGQVPGTLLSVGNTRLETRAWKDHLGGENLEPLLRVRPPVDPSN